MRETLISSMTGYGEAHSTIEGHEVVVEITTLNSRFLDIFMTLPDFLERYEIPLRNLISSRIRRGRVRVKVKVEPLKKYYFFSLKKEPLVTLLEEIKELRKDYPFITFDITGILRGMLQDLAGSVPGDVEEFYKKLIPIVEKAISRVERSRRSEGRKLVKDIRKRLQSIEKLLKKIEPLKEEELKREKEKISELENGVIGQEGEEALQISLKLDTTEEMERLKAHIKTFRSILENSEPIKGRKLEFLTQELHREATTLSQKSLMPEIITLTIEMREEIERIREQLRNIE